MTDKPSHSDHPGSAATPPTAEPSPRQFDYPPPTEPAPSHPNYPPPGGPPDAPSGYRSPAVPPPPGPQSVPVAPLAPSNQPGSGQPYGGYGRDRPWWGMGDVLLGAVFIVVTVMVGSVVGLIAAGGEVLDTIESGDTTALPVAFLGISLLFQQFGQGVWPFIVSKWKGLGPRSDWGFEFKWIDAGIGLGTAMIGLAAAGVAGLVASELVDLTDDASADNTQFLTDAEGTPWLYLIVFLVVVGAPFTEELLFRGLTLRAIEKRLGSAAAVIGSSIIFTVPHWIGSDWRGTLVLFASIFAVGLVLATTAVMTRRLGGPILAHMIFNLVGAAGALGWFDGLGV